MKDDQEHKDKINKVLAAKYQNFGQLLKKARKASGLNAAEFSALAEIHINSQSNYENNKRDPNIDYLIQFSGFLDVSFWQLMARRVQLSSAQEDHKRRILEEIELFYNYLQNSYSNGIIDQNSTSQVAEVCYALMAEYKSNPDVIVLKQNGDSMAPTINDNDTLFIDSTITKLTEGDIFVFKFNELYSAKRVQLVPGDGFMLISDNSNFHPVNMTKDSLSPQMIVGKLVTTISHFNR